MSQNPSQKAAVALAGLRKEIDALDGELVVLLAKRQRCVERVIAIKQAENLPARIPERIEEVVARVRALALTQKLEPDLADALWRLMIERFIAFEEQALSGDVNHKPS